MTLSPKEKVEKLRVQWKKLWKERVDDKIRAEGVAAADYFDLFVERGTIIHATRSFKALDFKEILEKNQVENVERYIPPDPCIGGWTKFIRTNMKSQRSQKHNHVDFYYDETKPEKQQLKKGGRGWLHK
jgi:hypothetical protein